MIIESLTNKLEDSGMGFFSRQEGVDHDVIAKDNTTRVIIPERLKADIEAIERYAEASISSGLCIKISLAEIYAIVPRKRRRIDSYKGLVRYLADELNVTLIINSNKTKKV